LKLLLADQTHQLHESDALGKIRLHVVYLGGHRVLGGGEFVLQRGGGFFALFAWQSGTYFRRNRPGRYRPDGLPRDLVP